MQLTPFFASLVCLPKCMCNRVDWRRKQRGLRLIWMAARASHLLLKWSRCGDEVTPAPTLHALLLSYTHALLSRPCTSTCKYRVDWLKKQSDQLATSTVAPASHYWLKWSRDCWRRMCRCCWNEASLRCLMHTGRRTCLASTAFCVESTPYNS